ncbi:MAG: stage II sporulation protein M [Candidatus Bathyarchaeota archaeon]|nr:MAG: stage II sporulation protein M [Candidatus Bathyarchaeota archaeon]
MVACICRTPCPMDHLTKAKETLQYCLYRNRTIIKVTALSFFLIIFISMIMTVTFFSVAPGLSDWFWSMAESERRYVAIPPAFTEDLYFFIFLNNVGHFWNPVKILVWIPLLGTFILGLELLLNGVIIGVVAVTAGITYGALYPILGLTPHGIVEIPAFILQFSSIIRWHITATEAVMKRAIGEEVDVAKLRRDVKDTVILAVVSLVLLMIAALIETYITPYLLGM